MLVNCVAYQDGRKLADIDKPIGDGLGADQGIMNTRGVHDRH